MEVIRKLIDKNTVLVEVKNEKRNLICASLDGGMLWDILTDNEEWETYNAFEEIAKVIMSGNYDAIDIGRFASIDFVMGHEKLNCYKTYCDNVINKLKTIFMS